MSVALGVALPLAPTFARPKDMPDAPPPKALQDVLGCKSVAEADKRLACFDAATAALAGAIERRDVAVADREQVRKARRSLFGLSLPSIDIFGGSETEAEKAEAEVTDTVRSARLDGDGYYVIVLASDGAVWHQTAGQLALPPRTGETVKVRRAALGSYFIRVGSMPAVRARRDR